MSDKNDPSAQGTQKGGAYSSSVSARKGSGGAPKEGAFRRFLNWLAPPEGGGEAPAPEPSHAEPQESTKLRLTLPGGGQITLKAKEIRELGPEEKEVILEPPPDNPAALLKVLAEFLGVPLEIESKTPTDDSLPAVVPMQPPPSEEIERGDITPLPEAPPKPAPPPPALRPTPKPTPKPEPKPAPKPSVDPSIEDMVRQYAGGGAKKPKADDDDGDMILGMDGGMAAQAGSGGQTDLGLGGGGDLPSLGELSPEGENQEVNLDLQVQASLDAHSPDKGLREEDLEMSLPTLGDKPLEDDLAVPDLPPVPPRPKKKEKPTGAPNIIGRASPLVGFDFGTSYTAAAVYDDGFTLIENEEGEVQMPSVVSFPSPDWTMIGTQARERMSSEAQWTITSPKRLLGRPYKDPKVALQLGGLAFKTFAGSDKFARFEAHGEIYGVGDICGMILKEMKSRAEKLLGCEVKRGVFAVPVSHGSIQRSALELAARSSGIEVVALLTEPSASVLAHGIRGRKGTVAVYDFGGGTFDFCVLKVRETAFQVLCAGGEPWLGGDDFDTVMANHISELFQKQTGIDLRTRAVELQALLFACEQAKRELSSKSNADLRLGDLVFTSEGKKGLRYRLSRRQFDKLTAHLIKKSLLISEKVLAQAGLKPSDVDTVVMSGGTSLIPKVRERVAEFFDLKPLVGEPDLAVVKGTALRAAELDGVPIDATSLSGRTLKEVAGRTIGIGIKGGPTITLIERNMPLPAEVSHSFPTQKAGQTEMVVGLYEESKSRIDESKTIGHLRYKGIKPAPKGERAVDFNFLLDEDSMLHVTAIVEGKEFNKTIKLG